MPEHINWVKFLELFYLRNICVESKSWPYRRLNGNSHLPLGFYAGRLATKGPGFFGDIYRRVTDGRLRPSEVAGPPTHSGPEPTLASPQPKVDLPPARDLTATANPTATLTPTFTPAPAPTYTPLPTYTLYPTYTPFPTPTPFQAPAQPAPPV